jgi:hypothetical protein
MFRHAPGRKSDAQLTRINDALAQRIEDERLASVRPWVGCGQGDRIGGAHDRVGGRAGGSAPSRRAR